MHPTLLCDLGRNSFIFVARASLSFILMSWQVWLSLCWDGQLSHTRLHKIAETKLFPQLLSFGLYAGALLRDGLPKKVAVLLDFVQMRGGRALPKFFVQFSRIYWVNLGMGREGETPAQIFWHIGVKKKWYKLSKLGGGGGGGGNWEKKKKKSYFFSGNCPLTCKVSNMSLNVNDTNDRK